MDLVVTDQAIDTTTPAGQLLFHVLASTVEFERALIVERACGLASRGRGGRAGASVDRASM